MMSHGAQNAEAKLEHAALAHHLLNQNPAKKHGAHSQRTNTRCKESATTANKTAQAGKKRCAMSKNKYGAQHAKAKLKRAAVNVHRGNSTHGRNSAGTLKCALSQIEKPQVST
jgi:hypothetical protein